uniref:Uncharacterized protein n=1 Tax=Meloidogyne incognita TaxID=6306 RepID=A0A914LLS3_MELIC
MPLPERQNEHVEDEDGTSHIKLLQQKLFEHYHTVAYTIVIFTCFLAFCEYLYLRLVSFIFPEPIIYRRKCEKHYNEVVLRNELHFASGLAVFLVMGIFQILCFFLLTISKKLLDVRRTTFSQVISIEERLHIELVFAVKRTMFATLYPTFAIYLLCSSVIYCDIFYMVGLRDPIVHGGSLIIIYIFDACVILYFLAFPVLCILFHPEINCCQARMSKICCCFTCIWQTQRRRRDRANAQPLGNRHLELSKIQNYKIIKNSETKKTQRKYKKF